MFKKMHTQDNPEILIKTFFSRCKPERFGFLYYELEKVNYLL